MNAREQLALRSLQERESASLPDVYGLIVAIGGRQLQDRNRIDEIQDSLRSIEAKLDALLAERQPPEHAPDV